MSDTYAAPDPWQSTVDPSTGLPHIYIPASPTRALLGQGTQGQGTDLMGQYANAIARIESSGRYDLQGPTTRTGDRAYGKYQVMGANVGPWTKEVLGQELTPSQFLNNPAAQDQVFRSKFGQYVTKYGNASDAASAWFTGGPQSSGSGKFDVLGTTGAKYVDMFNAALGGSAQPQGTNNLLASTQPARQAGMVDQLLGLNGTQRYQLWPERLVRDALNAPQQAQALAASGLQGRDLDTALVPGAQAMASFAGSGALPGAARGALGAMGGKLTVPNVGGQGVAPFYSSAMQALDRASFQRASAQQWLGYLRNQPGVKAEELEWMGTPEWLQGQSGQVTKAELANHMQEQSPQLQEVVKGGTPNWTQQDSQRLDWLEDSNNRQELSPAEEQERQALIDRENAVSQPGQSPPVTKFASYAMPGATPGSYKELLLTLPSKEEGKPLGYWANIPERTDYRSSHWDEPNVLAHVRMNDREVVPSDGGKPLRTLFLEEIQSDWHQQGRREGYQKGSSADLEASQKFFDYAKANFLNRVISHGATEREANNMLSQLEHASEQRQFYSREHNDVEPLLGQTERLFGLEARQLADTYIGAFERKAAAQDEMNKGVPNAPFKSSWPELALKRMIREAAEAGYDAIGWTPGEVQAARYDLSKQLKAVHATNNGDGTYELRGKLNNGEPHSFGERIPEKSLPDYVGKDLAQKIIDAKPVAVHKVIGNGPWSVVDELGHDLGVGDFNSKTRAQFYADKADKTSTFRGLDLRVGGEGMLKFYDDMLPNVANKLGKKYGARVEQGNARIREPGAPSDFRDQPVHLLRITPELRQRALSQGFPLFSAGVPLSVVGHGGRVHTLHPVSHDPFSNEGIQRGESL